MRQRIFLFIFFVYVVIRVVANISAIQNPRELADTTAYLRISQAPISNQEFWGDARPFVFPLLLKISSQNVSVATVFHLGLSILAWGCLAWMVSESLRGVFLKFTSFGVLLVLSMVRHLASWDYVMMTESLSVTFLVLFLALGIWLVQKWTTYKVAFLLAASFFLAFTRDTNSYLLLILAVMLILAVILHWMKPHALILAFSFVSIFLFNNLLSDIGSRWVFPLNNLIGKRVLTNSSALTYFEVCGMPTSSELLQLADTYANGQDRAFYVSPALEDYRVWLYSDGKSCYMKYLISNPVQNITAALEQFESLVRFEKLDSFFARQYDPVIPYYFEPFIYPVNFILPIWVLLTLITLRAVWKRAWGINPLWGVSILLCLPILPHLFVAWHGDAMAPERHALVVGLQLVLCFWINLFLLLDRSDSKTP